MSEIELDNEETIQLTGLEGNLNINIKLEKQQEISQGELRKLIIKELNKTVQHLKENELSHRQQIINGQNKVELELIPVIKLED